MNNRSLREIAPAVWWRIAFYLAATGAVVLACMPSLPDFHQQLSDKVLHFVAFAALTALATAAYPAARPGVVFVGLSILGLGIEILQSVPAIDRSPEAMDFAVDVFAVGLTLIFFRLAQTLVRSNRHSRTD